MTTLGNIFNVAQLGMQANQVGVAVAGENINGANTPGYSRRNAIIERSPVDAFITGGVRATGVARLFDTFAFRSLVREQALYGAADARKGSLTRLEAAVAPSAGAGLDDRFAEFFGALDTLALRADDPTARLEVTRTGQAIANSFNQFADALSTARAELLTEAVDLADGINDQVTRIAALNLKISQSTKIQTSGRAQLLDERDRLIRDVAESIEVAIIPRDDGSVTLLSSGAALVEQGTAHQLKVTGTGPNNDLKIELIRPGSNIIEVTSRVRGGRLGGLREARDKDIVAMQKELDKLAYDFGSAVNAVHTTGLDLYGNPAVAMFRGEPGPIPVPPTPGAGSGLRFEPLIAADPNLIAAGNAGAPPPGGNTVALAMSALQITALGLPPNGTPAERVADFAGKLGSRVASSNSESTLRDSTRAHAEEVLEGSSGVSLDEEMVNLTRYQRAFEASMRVLKTADEMLQHIVERL